MRALQVEREEVDGLVKCLEDIEVMISKFWTRKKRDGGLSNANLLEL